MLKNLFVILVCQSVVLVGLAQKPDSAAIAAQVAVLDSTLTKSDYLGKTSFVRRTWQGATHFIRKDYPNPRKAMFLSLALPGAGQAYNRAWWKLPLVYGGLGGMVWLESNNLRAYRTLKTAYFNKVNDLPVEPPYDRLDATSLRFRRNEARRNLELSSIFLGLSYLLVTAEAFVDAHLNQFDVGDDLSLEFKPAALPNNGIGLAVCLNLNPKKTRHPLFFSERSHSDNSHPLP